MKIIKGTIDNFDDVIKKGDVLVDFFATWCGPCKMLAPELESISDKVQIMEVDIDENLELCKRFGVMSVPTLIYFKKDNVYNTNIGYMPAEEILEFIKK
jgi:thioredoxin